jgi:ATP-dependent DNA helicase RecG
MAAGKRKDPREYMQMAIEVMQRSIQENRTDKASPYVGAVLVFPDGTTDTAFRGELRQGDHAEYTLIDKKNRTKDLTDCWLFATLEPCAPGARNAPKISCSERIVNARIAEVWFGIEDPDPKVDHGGIIHMEENGVKVHQFDPDLHKIIEDVNKEFLKGANKRRKEAKEATQKLPNVLDQHATNTDLKNLSNAALQKFITESDSKLKVGSEGLTNDLLQMELVEKDKKSGKITPTGNAILLFGEKPRLKFPQSSVKAKVNYGDGKTDVQSFDDALVLIPDEVEAWVKKVIPESFDRSKFKREKVPAFPVEVIREAIINAIIHRDYSIEGAKVQLEITPEKVIVRSPGSPIPPVTLEDLQNFKATSISRNKSLALIFNMMKYMEETGVGMDTYREMRDKYKLPLPIITYESPNLVVTFPRTPDAIRSLESKAGIENLNNEELAGLDFVKSRGKVSRKEYEDYFGFNERKANRHLKKLVALGLIGDNGKKPTSPNYRYVFNG